MYVHVFIKKLENRFEKNDIGVTEENKEKYFTSLHVKIYLKLEGVTKKYLKQDSNDIKLRFIVSCSSFDRSRWMCLASNL